MSERDYWGIMLVLGLMSVSHWLHARMLGMQVKMIAELQAEVAFLRDVARTDSLRSDHD